MRQIRKATDRMRKRKRQEDEWDSDEGEETIFLAEVQMHGKEKMQ